MATMTLTKVAQGITETVTFHPTFWEYKCHNPAGRIETVQERYDYSKTTRSELIARYTRDGFISSTQMEELHGER